MGLVNDVEATLELPTFRAETLTYGPIDWLATIEDSLRRMAKGYGEGNLNSIMYESVVITTAAVKLRGYAISAHQTSLDSDDNSEDSDANQEENIEEEVNKVIRSEQNDDDPSGSIIID